jgi:NAD(P)-dependent dehydrogenase (short-subunit alcohol dehydrogenase family)
MTTTIPTAVVVGVGAEEGLGAALCRRFATGGYHLLVAGRTASKIETLARGIVAAGGTAEAVAIDTTSEKDIQHLFDRAIAPGAKFSPADLVVYNAGNNRRIDFRELSAETFEEFWRVGCFGGFLVGREAARRLVPLRAACAASPALLISPPPRRGCARSPRAWRANSGHKACMSPMW